MTKTLNQTELKEIFQEISQLVQPLLSNLSIETVKVPLDFEVPINIYNIVASISKKFNIDKVVILSKMASEGFQATLRNTLLVGQSVQKESFPDLTKIATGLDKMNEMIKKLQNIQKGIENVSESDIAISADTKDH